MTQRIILFNGPPRCGKDTAAIACFKAEDLNNHYRVFERMSLPLKKAFAGLMGAPVNPYGIVAYHEDHKEEIVPEFGVSYRQVQIDMSEKYMRPLYGERILGNLLLTRLRKQSKDALILVPDCGFDIEYKTLVDVIGPENALVVKIYRPGTDFKNDPRTYLKVGSFGDKRDTEHVIHVNNAGTEDEFKCKIITRVSNWLAKESS